MSAYDRWATTDPRDTGEEIEQPDAYLTTRESRLPHINLLDAQDTLATAHTCDLKIEIGVIKFWVSRLDRRDGEPYDRTVAIEKLIDGAWLTIGQYDGENPPAMIDGIGCQITTTQTAVIW